ncbi:hypothetical protein [Pseudooceanicola sp.]|uniref:hypothetical protein n=1 Tax=Pseudooceanicola sp. TaxID=1914328 RepID=UPI0035C6E0DB
MVDPDRPIRVVKQEALKFSGLPKGVYVTGGLLRALQHIASEVDDRSPENAWRIEAYKRIAEDLSFHSHAGTGSEAEKQMLNVLGLVAKVLGVENV